MYLHIVVLISPNLYPYFDLPEPKRSEHLRYRFGERIFDGVVPILFI